MTTDFRNRRAIEELNELLDGGVSASASSELRSLASLATTVATQTVLLTPDPAFRTHLRAQLLRLEPVAHPSLGERLRDRADAATATGRRALRVATAGAVAASMLGTAGVAAASESALPGDVLYSVKSLVESTRLALADSGAPDGRLLLSFARERLNEIAAGTERLSDDQLVDLLVRMDAASIAGAEEILTAASAATTSELLTLVLDFVEQQEALLRAVEPELPVGVAAFVADSFENLRRIELAVETLAAPICDCDDPVALPAAPDQIITTIQLAPAVPEPVTIVPAGQGPAVPARPCECGAALPTPPREPAPVVDAPTPVPVEDADPAPTPDPDPTSPPDSPPDPEPEPTDNSVPLPTALPTEVTDVLDPILDELLDGLPDPVEEVVDVVVEEAVEPVVDLVDDLVDDSRRR